MKLQICVGRYNEGCTSLQWDEFASENDSKLWQVPQLILTVRRPWPWLQHGWMFWHLFEEYCSNLTARITILFMIIDNLRAVNDEIDAVDWPGPMHNAELNNKLCHKLSKVLISWCCCCCRCPMAMSCQKMMLPLLLLSLHTLSSKYTCLFLTLSLYCMSLVLLNVCWNVIYTV